MPEGSRAHQTPSVAHSEVAPTMAPRKMPAQQKSAFANIIYPYQVRRETYMNTVGKILLSVVVYSRGNLRRLVLPRIDDAREVTSVQRSASHEESIDVWFHAELICVARFHRPSI